MRLILGITLLLLGVGTLSCRVENSIGDGSPIRSAGQWVRTVGGWERTETWQAVEAFTPQLHPLVVAAGQGLISVLGLVACRQDKRVVQVSQQR